MTCAHAMQATSSSAATSIFTDGARLRVVIGAALTYKDDNSSK